ncbi:DUF6090 family protein [Ichthyenterobacterium sp. W332]|uniref:DUF6090 family protein n=1 Tax=Microcosmobacter mediterraneus TaxID=3075607 RepID=A0ABU2YI60_9FLAO|nr:DUF6090 family protein [Ichthyenterobacterium sp. W332]MDT0557836.1 DUF6090 family protein [Ichthyenterobacterium sp. W332]
MIKFFRHIRKSLIEKNQMGKYFKYAIGEILLVVIGILIALQINNWNEKRKKEILKRSYFANLIYDLKKDTAQLNYRLEVNKRVLPTIDSLLNVFDTYKSVESLYEYLSTNPTPIGLRVNNTYNVNTFNILISSGNIDLFSNEFTNKLMELNRLQLAEIKVSEGNSASFFNGVANFREQFIDNRGLKNEALLESITSNYDHKKYISKYYNLLAAQEHTINRYIELTTRVKLQTEIILADLISGSGL